MSASEAVGLLAAPKVTVVAGEEAELGKQAMISQVQRSTAAGSVEGAVDRDVAMTRATQQLVILTNS